MLGNIYQESNGEPNAGNYPGNYGLIQWTPANQGTYTVPNNSSVTTQVGYIIKYIAANGSIGAINANASSPSAAALYFSTHYERPLASAANNPVREQSAEEVYAAATSGNWPSSGAGTAPPPADNSGGLLDIPSQITQGFSDFSTFISAVMWLTEPGSWLRIGAFFVGSAFLIAGIIMLAKSSGLDIHLPKVEPVPIPLPV